MLFVLKPKLFYKVKDVLLPVFWVVSLVAFGYGIYLALLASPPDYQQKDVVRIMYVHVPAAWLAMGIYGFMALMNLIGFVWRNLLAFLVAKAAAPIGLTFNILCIVTGSLWGKPMWGAWWVWDARLTSITILAFLYMGYIILIDSFEDQDHGLKMGAILSLMGIINLPIIKWSVTWWNTLHQPASVFRMGGPTIHPDMLWPLGVMALGFTCLAAALVLMRTDAELVARRVRVLTFERIRKHMA
jgi:heme exporter protein C